jgi:hypothetical protein
MSLGPQPGGATFFAFKMPKRATSPANRSSHSHSNSEFHQSAAPPQARLPSLDFRCFGMLLFEFLNTLVECRQLPAKEFDFSVILGRPELVSNPPSRMMHPPLWSRPREPDLWRQMEALLARKCSASGRLFSENQNLTRLSTRISDLKLPRTLRSGKREFCQVTVRRIRIWLRSPNATATSRKITACLSELFSTFAR